MRPLALCFLLCWIWHMSDSFFLPSKKEMKVRNKGSGLDDILGKMNNLINFAFSVARPGRNRNVCPSYTCTDNIESGCRQAVYYIIEGRRCMGCDIDVCKKKRREQQASAMSQNPLVRQHTNRFMSERMQHNPFSFENRWLLGLGLNTESQFDISNSFSEIGPTKGLSLESLPPGAENSWITSPHF